MILNIGLIASLQTLMIYNVVNSTDPVDLLLNYGFAGILIALLATGVFRWKGEVTYLQEENKELRAILRNTQTQMTTQTIPAMERNVQVLEAIPDRELAMVQELKNTQENFLRDLMTRLEGFGKPGGKT